MRKITVDERKAWRLAASVLLSVAAFGTVAACNSTATHPRPTVTVTVDNTVPASVARAMDACRGVWSVAYNPCISLAMVQPVTHVTKNSGGASTSDPSGLFLVRHCRMDYVGAALERCFINEAMTG